MLDVMASCIRTLFARYPADADVNNVHVEPNVLTGVFCVLCVCFREGERGILWSISTTIVVEYFSSEFSTLQDR